MRSAGLLCGNVPLCTDFPRGSFSRGCHSCSVVAGLRFRWAALPGLRARPWAAGAEAFKRTKIPASMHVN